VYVSNHPCDLLTLIPYVASNNDSNDNSASASTFGASSTSTGVVQSTNAASNVKLGASSAGLFGLVLAAFAL
jgi:hypothetical protein